MTALEQEKKYEVSDKIREGLKDFYGGFATVEDTNETIGKMYRENGYLIDTHTAVAASVYKKYENGFVEIYQCSQITVILSNDYMPSSAKWTPCDFTLPEAIKELYSINTNISDTQENALMGCSYRKPPTISGYKLYIFDFAQVRTKDVVVYTTITGKWK